MWHYGYPEKLQYQVETRKRIEPVVSNLIID